MNNTLNTLKNSLKSTTVRAAFLGMGALCLIAPGVAMADGPTEEPAQHERHHHKHAKLKAMTPEQRQAFRAERQAKRIARMTAKLDLDEAQVKQMTKLMEAAKAEIQEARQLNEGDREATRAAVKALKKSYRVEMAKVLTPEQQATFKTMRKHKRGKRHMRKMIKALNLTEAQKTQAKALKQSHRAQAKALIAQAGGDREAVKPQLKALRKSGRAEFFKMLTPEQQTKLKAMRKHKRAKRGA